MLLFSLMWENGLTGTEFGFQEFVTYARKNLGPDLDNIEQ